jgi:micrococcal nuclease
MIKKIFVGIGVLLLLCVVLAIALPASDDPETAESTPAMATAESTTPTARSSPSPSPSPLPIGPAMTEAQVTEVVDGDTLKVSIAGQPQTIRLIGVDTPETKDPSSPVMCYGAEATAKTQELVDLANGHVLLEKDVSKTDRYGRLLRYVWLVHLDGRRMLNEELVKGGFAQVSTYPPDVKYQDAFLAADREARESGAGLWGACGSFGAPAEEPEAPPEAAPAPAEPEPAPGQTGGNCDPSYPGVCIPPPPPGLNCGDISYSGFAVQPPDPHDFDGNHDGVGCES